LTTYNVKLHISQPNIFAFSDISKMMKFVIFALCASMACASYYKGGYGGGYGGYSKGPIIIHGGHSGHGGYGGYGGYGGIGGYGGYGGQSKVIYSSGYGKGYGGYGHELDGYGGYSGGIGYGGYGQSKFGNYIFFRWNIYIKYNDLNMVIR
jgi:hypothetical protein